MLAFAKWALLKINVLEQRLFKICLNFSFKNFSFTAKIRGKEEAYFEGMGLWWSLEENESDQ